MMMALLMLFNCIPMTAFADQEQTVDRKNGGMLFSETTYANEEKTIYVGIPTTINDSDLKSWTWESSDPTIVEITSSTRTSCEVI